MITGDVISVNMEMIIGDLEFNIEDLESPLLYWKNLWWSEIGHWWMAYGCWRCGKWSLVTW